MDFLNVEMTHELHNVLADDLTGHQDWKSGWIGDDENCCNDISTSGDCGFGFLDAQELASRFVVCQEKRIPQVAFPR